MIDGRRRRTETGSPDDATSGRRPLGTPATGVTGAVATGTGAPPADPDPANTGGDRTASWLHPGQKLGELGVPADAVTIAGLFLAACTAIVLGRGYLYLGVALITVGGLMDFLDGSVAKAAGTASPRGAFFDSVSDRVADALILGGVAWYLVDGRHPKLALLTFAILAVSTIVSYERAKAESLGFEAKGGLMERAERLILLSIGLFFPVILVPVLWVLLVLTAGTGAGRFLKVWRQASGTAGTTGAIETLIARPWHTARVESRWLEWRLTGQLSGRDPSTPSWSRRRAGAATAPSTNRRIRERIGIGIGPMGPGGREPRIARGSRHRGGPGDAWTTRTPRAARSGSTGRGWSATRTTRRDADHPAGPPGPRAPGRDHRPGR